MDVFWVEDSAGERVWPIIRRDLYTMIDRLVVRTWMGKVLGRRAS